MPGTPEADSLWRASAKPAPQLRVLAHDLQSEVAIVGAGYTGLAAAHELASRGVDCVVIEAHDVGWGASGRNGGMAVLRYKSAWAALAHDVGAERTRHLHRLLLGALDRVEELVQAYDIDCGFARCGHITAANGRKALAMLQRDVQWLAANSDSVPRLLDGAQTCALTGAAGYAGGYLDPRAAAIHPLDYVRGLAGGLASRGVPIHIGTRVEALQEEADGVVLETPGGRIRARQALIATNAYTEIATSFAGLAARIVPVSTSAVSTVPLSAGQLATVLPQRHIASDTRHLLNWFRIGPGQRLVFGGRASLTGKEAPGVYAGLERRLAEAFPSLAEVPIEHRWSGKVAVTLDDFPHVGRLGPRVAFAMGYGGRGVILSHLLGRLAAKLMMGEVVDAGPMSTATFHPIPLQPLRIPAMKAVAGYYGLLDKLRL